MRPFHRLPPHWSTFVACPGPAASLSDAARLSLSEGSRYYPLTSPGPCRGAPPQPEAHLETRHSLRLDPMPYVVFVVICFVWGASFLLMKKAVLAFTPVGVGAWRVVGGALALALIAWWQSRRPRLASRHVGAVA